ncbi:response regulator transcription factor [Pseudomonas sp. SED1]|uniref:response regulator transcription factor n=1 Tax=Pseudomonas sp. SED1 TaxID=3056845 RepID=UPI00296FC590|nr:response regulator transcription factor [Pseudomonas sp. SED1]MDY0834176.1 response regulator transcription factor [Pseudomonas sp. SED1]
MKWSNLARLRVALLDDHAIIRSGFSSRLSAERDIEVVALYGNSRELLTGLRNQSVDVLVLDYTLQQDELDGLNLIRLLRIRFPDVRILIYSATESAATISLSLRAGVRGFIGKSQELDELMIAVRTVANERIYLDKMVALELGHVPGFHEGEEVGADEADGSGSVLVSNPLLSPREQEVLRCCLQGMSVSQIAIKFTRSRKTISGQKQSAFRKLGISSDIELFKIRSELED